MTKIVDLAYNSRNILCQNVTTLVIGNMYQLNFTVYNSLMNTSEIRVLVNNKSAFNHTTLSINTLSKASYVMTAQATNTQICFNYSLASTWTNVAVGPCLDNITLELFVPITNLHSTICNGDFEAYKIRTGA